MKIIYILFLQASLTAPLAQAAGPAETSAPIQNWQSLYLELERQSVPFAHYFTRVAIVETGWGLREGVGQFNNLFGMRSRPGFYATGHGYAIYPSHTACIRDLSRWVAQEPPRPNEQPETFLRRRGWNPFEGYFEYVATVDPFSAYRAEVAHALKRCLGHSALALLGRAADAYAQQPVAVAAVPVSRWWQQAEVLPGPFWHLGQTQLPKPRPLTSGPAVSRGLPPSETASSGLLAMLMLVALETSRRNLAWMRGDFRAPWRPQQA